MESLDIPAPGSLPFVALTYGETASFFYLDSIGLNIYVASREHKLVYQICFRFYERALLLQCSNYTLLIKKILQQA